MVIGSRENAATAWWFPGAYYIYKDRGFVLSKKPELLLCDLWFGLFNSWPQKTNFFFFF